MELLKILDNLFFQLFMYSPIIALAWGIVAWANE